MADQSCPDAVGPQQASISHRKAYCASICDMKEL
jgi:hypothetical protein